MAGNRVQQIVTIGGTPTSIGFAYDAANRLTEGINEYTYDDAGRLVDDGVNTYTWDRADRLLTMGGVSYQYDGQGRRVQQTVEELVTRYLLDVQPGLERVLQATTSGDTTRYVHGPLGLLQQQNPDDAWLWPLMDGLGSLRAVVDDEVAGLETRHYSPYGEGYGGTGSQQTVFGFTGEPTDSNGLLHLRNRYYNPAIGQFFNLDPLEGGMGNPMSLDRYMYVLGNVVNRVDPSGLINERPERWAGCNNLRASSPCNGSTSDDKINDVWTDYMPEWDVKLTVSCGLENTNEVLLEGQQQAQPVHWIQEHKDHLTAAFSRVNERLNRAAQIAFRNVFGGVEFRYVAGGPNGDTPTVRRGYLIKMGPGTRLVTNRDPEHYGIPTVGSIAGTMLHKYGFYVKTNDDEGIEHTIIHELGHAFDYRTGRSLHYWGSQYHLPSIKTTQIGRFWEHGDLTDTDTKDDPMTESIADHFLNWVYESYVVNGENVNLDNYQNNTSPTSKRLAAFWIGGINFDKIGASPGVKQWAYMAAYNTSGLPAGSDEEIQCVLSGLC